MGHQSYVLLCTETTLSNHPEVFPKSSCDVHLLRSPWFIKAHLQNCILFAFVFKTSVANCCKNCKRWRILGNADLWQTRVEICQGFDFAFFFRFGFFRLLRLALFFSVNNKKGMYKDFEYGFLLSIHLCYNFCGYEFDKYSLYYIPYSQSFVFSKSNITFIWRQKVSQPYIVCWEK